MATNGRLQTRSALAARLHIAPETITAWRRRYAGTDDPFPAPDEGLAAQGVDVWDATAVDAWCERNHLPDRRRIRRP